MASFENRAHFSASEFENPEGMSNELISRLEIARGHSGIPFKITSSFRDGDGSSAHDHGLAVDIDVEPGPGVESRQRYLIMSGLLAAGFKRIGVYYSDNGGHIHADIGDTVDPSKWPPNVMWVGKSR